MKVKKDLWTAFYFLATYWKLLQSLGKSAQKKKGLNLAIWDPEKKLTDICHKLEDTKIASVQKF
jgi:hypothetical protein